MSEPDAGTPGAQVTLFKPGNLPELFKGEAVFLSASIPYRRPPDELPDKAARAANEAFVSSAHPERIRDAVTYLSRALLQRDISLVFGAHPAISPIVLDVARHFSTGTASRVLIFQSRFFDGSVTAATLELADWSRGTLLWTEARPASAPTKSDSLLWMREAMLASPNLIAGVFIGGMEGVLEEHALFVRSHPSLPTFALGSTGAAAKQLLDAGTGYGQRADEPLLRTSRSCPLVMTRILEDLGKA